MTLSAKQKKIIYIFCITIGFLFSFWMFVYRPQNKKLNNIKLQIADVEKQISEINQFAQGKELSQAVRDFQVGLKNLENKLFLGKEAVINILSETARKQQIKIINLSFLPDQPINDVVGYDIREFPIFMQLSGSYKAIGEYIEALKDDFPVFIRIRSLEINSKEEGQMILDIKLQLSAYLIK